MAKQKKEQKEDQHADGSFLIRFPAEFRPIFQAIKDAHGPAFTVTAQRAMRDYAAKLGIEPKKGDKT